jgi:hypothetical protein
VKVPVHPGPGSLRKGDRIVLPTGALTRPIWSVESGVDRQGPFTRIRIGHAEQTWRTRDATVEVAREPEIP